MGGWERIAFGWRRPRRFFLCQDAGIVWGLLSKQAGFLSDGIAGTFIMPWFSFNWLIEALVVLLYFPLMVSLGAGAQLSSRLRRSVCFQEDILPVVYDSLCRDVDVG